MDEEQTRVALVALAVLIVAAIVALWHPWSPAANAVAPSPSPQGLPSVIPSVAPVQPSAVPSAIPLPSSSPAVASPPALGGATCVAQGLVEPQCASGSQLVKAIGPDGCVSNYSCAPSMELLVEELTQMQLPGCTSDAGFAAEIQACREKPNAAAYFIRDAKGCLVGVNCTTMG